MCMVGSMHRHFNLLLRQSSVLLKSACVVPLPHNNTIVHSLLRISSTRQLTMAPISSSSATSDMQITQMKDVIPTVDENDVLTGHGTKRECHTRIGGDGRGKLHRAFSVFLFNSEKKLLLQRRSATKITFPGYYTNTCCSHPRYNPEELVEDGDAGIKTAAQRRMAFELGIVESRFPHAEQDVITRIHYFANSCAEWCEHELDYVIFVQGEVDLSAVNEDEVSETLYVSMDEMKEFRKNENVLFTPWFKYICDNFLYKWWEALDSLDDVKDSSIQRAGDQSQI